MRKLLAAALLAVPVTSAQDAFALVVRQLCPSGNPFACPALDFIIAFGITTIALYMGFNMVEIFASASENVRTALGFFSVIAGLATAFYVWLQKIAFFSLISSFSLFVVGLIVILLFSNLFMIGISRGEATWKSRLFLAGVGLIAVGILLFYFGMVNVGTWLMFAGFILAFIGSVWWLLARRGPPRARKAEEIEKKAEKAERREEKLASKYERDIYKHLKRAFEHLQEGTRDKPYLYKGEEEKLRRLLYLSRLELKHPNLSPLQRLAIIRREMPLINEVRDALHHAGKPSRAISKALDEVDRVAREEQKLWVILEKEMKMKKLKRIEIKAEEGELKYRAE